MRIKNELISVKCLEEDQALKTCYVNVKYITGLIFMRSSLNISLFPCYASSGETDATDSSSI